MPRRIASFLILVILFAGCTNSNAEGEVDAGEQYDRIIAALTGPDVLYLRYTFQDQPDRVLERHELWIDWREQRARREIEWPERPLRIEIVTNGLSYRQIHEPHPIETFELEALNGLHAFWWLSIPDEARAGPVRSFVEERDGVSIEIVTWTVDIMGSDSGVCGDFTLELDAETATPLRGWATRCERLRDGSEKGRGSVVEYERVESVERDSLPEGFFDPPPP